MNPRIILAALAVATIAFTAPAEAKGPRATRAEIGSLLSTKVDVAAIPAYPIEDRVKTARTPRHANGQRVGGFRAGNRPRQANKASPGPRQARIRPIGPFGTVPTAAGIDISCAPGFCAPAQDVIADLVATGFVPTDLGSYARGGHVHGSYHYRSRAIDVAQCGWGCTPAPKQILRMIVASHGLRDGCEFRDSGHFDDGPHLPFKRVLRNCGRAYADAVSPSMTRQSAAGVAPGDDRDPPFYPATSDFKKRQHHARKIRVAHR